MADYTKPGVYVEEAVLLDNGGASTATSVALFVGPAATGPTSGPVLCGTWSDYVLNFGGFDTFSAVISGNTKTITSYLPYAVYSYFQNGGRPAYVQRAIGTAAGTAASLTVTDGEVSPTTVFTITARSVGISGNNLGITVDFVPNDDNDVFNLSVFERASATAPWAQVEYFQHLTVAGGIDGTRKIDVALNDPYSGSSRIGVTINDVSKIPDAISQITGLTGGANPGVPTASQYKTPAQTAVSTITSPVILNLVGYTTNPTDRDAFVVPNRVNSSDFSDRGDVFIINDSLKPRISTTPAQYVTEAQSNLIEDVGDSYIASYTPWIIIPDPQNAGGTLIVPPGGAVAGVMSRIDSTIGTFRAPAGVVAQITNAVGVETKFTDAQLGTLNSQNVNAIRPVQGAGIAIMGARTRKLYGADRYVSARRTLIYVKESLKRSTQFALFENNDQRLWARLIATTERLLRPLWESGGLRGANAAEAYFVRCDDTINTPATIAAGEVRLEVGLALEYPAEFIVIRVSQYESGGFTAEVQPRG